MNDAHKSASESENAPASPHLATRKGPLLLRPLTWLGQIVAPAVVREPSIAVLIDGDGAGPKAARAVLGYLPLFGRICIKRVYGNFSGASAAAWTEITRDYGAVSRHMASVAPGKNATDIALAMDAIELLHTRSIDIFAIVSSDADFSPLAWRIKEEGKEVLGYGYKMTPRAFRLACTRFTEINALNVQHLFPAARWSLQPKDATALVLEALDALCPPGQAIAYKKLTRAIMRRHQQFDPRIFNRRTLHAILVEIPEVEVFDLQGERHVRRSLDSKQS